MPSMKSILSCVPLAAALASFSLPASADPIGPFHDVVTDADGKLLPWHSNDLGVAYDHTMHLVFEYWMKLPIVPTNGERYYMQVCRMNQIWPDSGCEGLGGDQVPMTLSSWRLYYAYTGDHRALDDMVYMADTYLRASLSPAMAKWPKLPYPYNLTFEGNPLVFDGDLAAGKDVTQPDKAASFGAELVMLYKMTGKDAYLTAATDIADTLAAHVVAGDATHSPWPYRVNAMTDEVPTNLDATYTTNWTGALRLFDSLIELGKGNTAAYQSTRSIVSAWLKNHPLNPSDPAFNKWGPFFEDIGDYSDTEINAGTMAWYILEHPEWDPSWKTLARQTLDWVYDANLVDKTWSSYGVDAIMEQTEYLQAGQSHTARHSSVELLYAEKTGDISRKEMAKRGLSWATYWVDFDGTNLYAGNDVWLTDGYGDFVRHFFRAMAAAPELAPECQDHILSTTSVVTDVTYHSGLVNYSLFDDESLEVLRISFPPDEVSVGGRKLSRLSSVGALAANEGYTFEAPGDTSGVLRIHHKGGKTVVVSGAPEAGSACGHEGCACAYVGETPSRWPMWLTFLGAATLLLRRRASPGPRFVR